MNESFSAWGKGFWYYAPLLAGGLALTTGLYPFGYEWAGFPMLMLGCGVLLFFRDFPRAITAAPGEVVSPADGTVVAIDDLEETPYYEGAVRRISIFLSIFDVHVNRAPFDGCVRAVRYAPGIFKDARDPDSSRVNESNALWLDTAQGPMTVRQISGAIARRIVCPVEVGATLCKGEKFGMIRFGSRTELYLPPSTEVCVKLRDKVHAGSSILARFK